MTQNSKLMTPDVVFNILNAELSSLATSFPTSLNAGVALVEGNLLVECYKLSPVLHVQDSPLLTKVLPPHHPLDIACFRAFASFEPKDVSSDYLEQEAAKGKGALVQALWTLYAKSKLYSWAYKA
ncbi:hypothetical protein TNCV_1902221 [Trichonephila clavipes]|nr:hypothetical protein TNCV_1902221 [Trichonephila clavipes]